MGWTEPGQVSKMRWVWKREGAEPDAGVAICGCCVGRAVPLARSPDMTRIHREPEACETMSRGVVCFALSAGVREVVCLLGAGGSEGSS